MCLYCYCYMQPMGVWWLHPTSWGLLMLLLCFGSCCLFSVAVLCSTNNMLTIYMYFHFFNICFFFFWEMCLQHWNINFSALWPTITNEYNFFWEYCCCSFFYVKIFCFMSNFSFDSRLNFLVIFVLAFVFIFVYNLSCIPWSFVVHLIFFLYSMDGWILDGWLTGWMFDCSAGVWWWGFAID